MAQRNDVKCLALTHIRRDVRNNQMSKIKEYISDRKNKVITPEPLDQYAL